MSTDDDIYSYQICIENIKARMIFIGDEYASRSEDVRIRYVSDAGPLFRFEGACLQLRKTLEFLVLSSLSANRKIYQEHWTNFRRENNLSKLAKNLQRVSRFDGRILPISVRKPKLDTCGTFSLTSSNRQLEVSDIVSWHGRLGNILHAENPYRQEDRVGEYQSLLSEACESVRKALQYHIAPLYDGSLLFVQMNNNSQHVTCHKLRHEEFHDV